VNSLSKSPAKRQWVTVHASNFTTASELARETLVLLKSHSFNVSILFDGTETYKPAKLYAELEGKQLFRRVKVREFVSD